MIVKQGPVQLLHIRKGVYRLDVGNPLDTIIPPIREISSFCQPCRYKLAVDNCRPVGSFETLENLVVLIILSFQVQDLKGKRASGCLITLGYDRWYSIYLFGRYS